MNAKKSEGELFSKVVFLPVLGRVPGPYPFPESYQEGRSVPFPEADLEGAADRYYYALEAAKENPSDDVHSKDYFVIEPDAEIEGNRVYIAHVEERVLSGHITRVNEKCLLFPSDDRFDRWVILEKDIIGRVIYSGTWKEL